MIAFLCFVVAHLEWPLIGELPLSLKFESGSRVYVDRIAVPYADLREPAAGCNMFVTAPKQHGPSFAG
ncbi:hypothetical protein NIIDNTM18_22040 [Mycolicibacterium litorale]|uniref:Uncharacterized protein n=1 Tax=Mycolicibacterium litorale TaxID=758802 RepID=A0A6S6P4G1_9MYCO|nr:hypothetical protein NIIDNTM18_22040 [Mycolicibacterium litorale]